MVKIWNGLINVELLTKRSVCWHTTVYSYKYDVYE